MVRLKFLTFILLNFSSPLLWADSEDPICEKLTGSIKYGIPFGNDSTLEDYQTVVDSKGKKIAGFKDRCDKFIRSPNNKFILNLCTNELLSVADRSIRNLKTSVASIDNEGLLYSESKDEKNTGVLRYTVTHPTTGQSKTLPGFVLKCGILKMDSNSLKLQIGKNTIETGALSPKLPPQCSENGRYVVFSVYHDGKANTFDVIKADMETGQQTTLLTNIESPINIAVANDGRHQIVHDGQILTFGPKGNVLIEMESYSSIDPTSKLSDFGILETTHIPRAYVKTNDSIQVCSDKKVKIYKKADDCACSLPSIKVEDLEKFKSALACEVPLSSEVWKSTEQKKPSSLTEEQLIVYLKRFQKPGGFDKSEHLPILLAAIDHAPSNEEVKSQVAAATAAILAHDNFYESLKKLAPNLTQILQSAKPVKLCRSKEELEAFDVQSIYKNFRREAFYAESTKKVFEFMQPYFKSLDENRKTQVIDYLTNYYSTAFSNVIQVSQSTADYMMTYKLNPYFDRKSKELLDTQVVRQGGEAYVVHFANTPFEVNGTQSLSSPMGISYLYEPIEKNGKTPGDQLIDKTVEIKMGPETFTSHTKATLLPGNATDFVNQTPKIDYKKLWADKKMTSMVLATANYFGEEDGQTGEDFMLRYQTYYINQGFTFSDSKTITNTKEYVLNSVKNGKVDFLIKEGHSQGNAHHVMTLSDNASLKVGTKTHSDGRIEEVLLLSPMDSGKSKQGVVGTDEFGEAVRERSQTTKQKPFIWLNGSCNSYGNVISEIESTRDSSLVAIPSFSKTTAFANHTYSPLKSLIDGIREQKSFDEIRSEMRKNQLFAAGEENVYVMPDDENYKKHIVQAIGSPMQKSVTMTKNGKGYSLTDELRH